MVVQPPSTHLSCLRPLMRDANSVQSAQVFRQRVLHRFRRLGGLAVPTVHAHAHQCSPTTGREVWTEQNGTVELALKNNVLVLSDEIHGNWCSRGGVIPMASLSEEFARNTLTCISPSKTFNLAGLSARFYSADAELRRRFLEATEGDGRHKHLWTQSLWSSLPGGGPAHGNFPTSKRTPTKYAASSQRRYPRFAR